MSIISRDNSNICICGSIMNIVMKTDQMTPKEKREVYGLKKDMIREILLHRKNRIISAQFQVRESDGFEFMFYKIKTSTNTVYLFHQPWRNVKNLYRPYEYKNMSQNPEPYKYVPYPDIDLDAHKTAAKFFLYLNRKRLMRIWILSLKNLIQKMIQWIYSMIELE